MLTQSQITPVRDRFTGVTRFRVYTDRHLDQIEPLLRLTPEQRFDMQVVASVLPFRVNQYVIDELIDWGAIPTDPIFQLTFPQRGMLAEDQFQRMASLHRRGAERAEIERLAWQIRDELNPHPAGQMQLNVPRLDGRPLQGIQHKYDQTVLFFPTQGQTCHSYCTFCFRWAQFVGDKDLRFAASEVADLHRYLRQNPQVTDLLMTGGDPMVMKTKYLASYLEPLLGPEFDHIVNIRIGTKALTFWPQRFVTDPDADALLALLERLNRQGKHVALMLHFNHWRELDTPICEEAIRRIRDTGAILRSQSPLIAHINDDAEVWANLWQRQVSLGIQPYYMFVERDTGSKHYFEVPLERAWNIYRDAKQQVSGLARTARGPSMSAGPGKVEIQGIAEVQGEQVFVLRFIQGRNSDWVQQPFFARFDPQATWLDQLRPAFGEQAFFFEAEYAKMEQVAMDAEE
ncbi:lysine 2,3-aminomutase [Magnetovirga frankeli]|nr:lysine 2,3-aminomutase [gamma proteobacterium SS-5]